MSEGNGKRKHLDLDARRVIEEGIESGLGARELARRIDVCPSTVTREIRANRTVRAPKRKDMSPSRRCANFRDCQRAHDACGGDCRSGSKTCRRCKERKCFDRCPDFELRMCEKTEAWPYVCTCYTYDRDACMLPKCRYRAEEADALARERRWKSREGISLSPEELAGLVERVAPLLAQGQSPEAIWAQFDDMPVCSRTFYNYVDQGAMDLCGMDLPRKVRFRPRKKPKASGAEKVDRTGRTYADYLALGDAERASAVQLDSVCGYARNASSILSLHIVRYIFQIYLKQPDLRPATTVRALDAIEAYLGSREAFERFFGLLLADRGIEFDDWAGIERSALEPGGRRCRLFYCDPMTPTQKAQCERNHEELRRILPKGRTDFDGLDATDVAVACSHVNSYPRRSLGGASPYDLASQVLPRDLLEALGIERVPAGSIVLNPRLIGHSIRL